MGDSLKVPIWLLGSEGFLGNKVKTLLNSSEQPMICFGRGYLASGQPKNVVKGFAGTITTEVLDSALKEFGRPETIINLAGGSSVARSFDHSIDDFGNTTQSTITLLDWARNFSPKASILMSSSAAVYGNNLTGNISETDKLKPVSPYGYNKLLSELICDEYSELFGMSITTLRLFSVYGAGLRKQLLWDACGKFQHPTRPTFFGTGDEIRDWVDAEFTAEIICKFISQEKHHGTHEIFNVGSGSGYSTREVLQIVSDCFEGHRDFVFNGKSRAGDPFSLIANTTKLQELIQYPYKSNLVHEISKYVSWFKSENKIG